jgi:hypothetical protein
MIRRIGLKMGIVGLDGIEKIVVAIDPHSRVQKAFECTGYMNIGTFQRGKLVEVYSPMGEPVNNAYRLSLLQDVSAQHNFVPKVYTRSTNLPDRKPEEIYVRPPK